VQGGITYTNRYCGGARPSEEMLTEYATPKNFVSTTIYLKRKKGGQVIYKIVTDKDGKFKKCIKPGKYFLYMSKYYNKKLQLNFNPNCSKAWTSYGQVEILNHAKKLYSFNMEFGCDPCSPPRP
jgi:L-rhamnose isomerase